MLNCLVLVLTVCYEIKRRLGSRVQNLPMKSPLYQPPLEVVNYSQTIFPCYQDPAIYANDHQLPVHASLNCDSSIDVNKDGHPATQFVHVDNSTKDIKTGMTKFATLIILKIEIKIFAGISQWKSFKKKVWSTEIA